MRTRDVLTDLVAREARPATPYGLYCLTGDDPASDLPRRLEEAVFLDAFGNTPDLLAREYDPYERATLFVAVIDHRREAVAGMLRIILPSPAGLKTLADLERVWGLAVTDAVPVPDLVEGNATWDVATLAVAPAYRWRQSGGLVTGALYHAVTMLVTHNAVRWVTATLDLLVLELIQRQCARPFRRFGGAEPRRYLGSPASLPVYCEYAGYRERLRLSHPDRHELLFHGSGLGDLISCPRWDLPATTAAAAR